MRKELNLSLCEGRYEIPQATDGAVFPSEISCVTDVKGLENKAFNSIWNAAYRHFRNNESGFLCSYPYGEWYEENELELVPGLHVNLYVTGLTVALIAALNVCKENKVDVTLWHYDRESGNYFPQDVI